MLGKIILLVLALFVIYLLFFKKSRKVDKKDDKLISDEMIECPACGVFTSQKEMILSNGRFFCSKECLKKGVK